ncbi:MAG: tetratricopeptide repeat protein [Bryobacteraceae bacterium]
MKRLLILNLIALAALSGIAAQQIPTSTPAPTPPPGPSPAAQRPPGVITVEMKADIAMARKEYRKAIELYQSIEPQTHVTLNKIGIGYHHLMELEKAKKYYERSAKMKKDYSEALNNLGAVHYAKRSYRRAVSWYNKALKYAPASASIHSNLGTAWFARKKYDRAAKEYQIALDLDPEVFEHRGTTGVLLQERSVQERAKFHYYLSRVYAQAGMADRCLMYMRKALEEGFRDRKKFVEDPEFAAMQQVPEFQALLEWEPRVL